LLLLAEQLKNPQRPPVSPAAVWVEGETIRFVGMPKDLPPFARHDPEQIDLGRTLLIPGLVNAHAHLEYTSLVGFPYPGSFTSWIRALLAVKNNSSSVASGDSLREGIRQTIRGGATTIADHASVTSDLEILLNSPLRGKVFVEVLGVVPEVAEDMAGAAALLEENYRNSNSRLQIIPSPHSVHALHPETLEALLRTPSALFSIHLGESEEEELYFKEKSGPLAKLIAERGSALTRPASSALRELDRRGLLTDRILAVHANYVDAEELEILARRNISIVHCPLSHRYFSHQPFPWHAAQKAGVNLALGTDSLASAASLSMFDVLRTVEVKFSECEREEIFAIATLGGAKALKMDDQIGSLEVGKKADMVAIPLSASGDALESIFQAEAAAVTWINGEKIKV
jgi:cytosine/adenosine deaminase-related metal-dependent hydrolase